MMRFSLLLILLPVASVQAQSVVINEFVASNQAGVVDEAGDHDDWVELYNASPSPVDLGGYYLTDDLNNPTAWQFPRTEPALTTLPPGGWLLLWLDDQPQQGVRHAGFRLDREGEQLGLFAPDGRTALDSLTFGPQAPDVSFGRRGDGSTDWLFFSQATPEAANPSTGLAGRAPAPAFSTNPSNRLLHLSSPDPNAQVYYTLDGREPAPGAATPYTDPIPLDTVTVVRARSYRPDHLHSPIVTRTYLTHVDYPLPVVSLVTDPAHLFDEETGIYVDGNPAPGEPENYRLDWERPAHVEYVDAGRNVQIRQEIGLKIYGGGSRRLPKKSFTILAEGLYGSGGFHGPLFADKPHLDQFDGLVLRGNAQSWARWRNDLVYELNRRSGNHIDMQAYEPVVLLINGAYWGVYNLTERKNADFVRANHEIDGDIDLLSGFLNGSSSLEGDRRSYAELKDFLRSDAYLAPEGFDRLSTLIDPLSFIDFWVYDIYSGRLDVENNVRMWRPRTSYGRWRWITYDFETTTWRCEGKLAEAVSTESDALDVYLLRSALRNPGFKALFVNRFLDLLNTVLEPDHISLLGESMAARLEPAMQADAERWPFLNISAEDAAFRWQQNVDAARDQFSTLQTCLRDALRSELDLGPDATLTLDAQPGGSIRVNTVYADAFPWSGTYLQDVPVTLTAVPASGYAFAGWSDGLSTRTRSLNLTNPATFSARFVPAAAPPTLVINELNYASAPAFESGDWTELHNPTPEAIGVAGWTIEDSDDNRFTFPEHLVVEPEGYLVLCRDGSSFERAYEATVPCLDGFEAGLSSTGETLYLRTHTGEIVDSVAFSPEPPWPAEAAGTGFTLALTDPLLDNALPEHWVRSQQLGGTPVASNQTTASTGHPTLPADGFAFFPPYPNPFATNVHLSYHLPETSTVELRLFDATGRRIDRRVLGLLPPGRHSLSWPAAGLSPGVYFFQLLLDGTVQASQSVVHLR